MKYLKARYVLQNIPMQQHNSLDCLGHNVLFSCMPQVYSLYPVRNWA